MLEKITYKNHIGEELSFGEEGIYANYSDIHDYLWNYQSESNRLSLFERGIVQKTLPLIINCDSEDAGIAIKNKLMEYAEKDVLAKEAGRLYVGDYYLPCYIIGSSKTDYLIKKGFMSVSLNIITDSPAWIKESTEHFSSGGGAGNNLDYPHDYPYDFTSEMQNKTLNNTGFTATDFVLNVYGECTDPEIYIANHLYAVECELEKYEYLSINSKTKTVTKVKRDGSTENLFSKRDKTSYIFEKIASGENQVTFEGDLSFDVVLLEERSEPKWT